MVHETKALSVFSLQMTGSWKLILILLSGLMAGLFGSLFTDIPGFQYLLLASVYFLIFVVGMAITTAIHETGHISKLDELGFAAENFVAHRVGNVSFRIVDAEKLTTEQCYEIAKAPFVRAGQYFAGVSILGLLIVINWFSPFPLSIALGVFSALEGLQLMANFCVYFVIRTERFSGLCVKLFQSTSRGDVHDIITWNRELQDQTGN
ncbi:MAG: hypothetical protein KAW94_02205 [Candidatus Thorarchaeota archaeon]|nr:hypothetical protein [Candidatus Thorarchaeota archaeon]